MDNQVGPVEGVDHRQEEDRLGDGGDLAHPEVGGAEGQDELETEGSDRGAHSSMPRSPMSLM